ncbi:MAG: helix-turn-helix domain-containing protein [Candidatus Falkowbacteria bacterium]
MKKKKNNNRLHELTKSKRFKESLEFSLFQTRISGIIFNTRKELGLSQKKLAQMAGTTQRIVSEAESGNYKIAEMLYRLFRTLNKELISDGEDLITGKKIKQSCYVCFVSGSEDVKEVSNLDAEDNEINNFVCGSRIIREEGRPEFFV